MALNIKPFQTEFLSKPVAAETASGFSFQTLQKKTTKGTVVAVEMELKEHTMTVKL
jgi:hypothetical protein